VTDLEPLFRLLVQRLAAEDPPRIHQTIAINELMDAVLPYRLVRRELGVDTAEDYEALLLQLCAGSGGYLQSDSATQAALAAELTKPLPDLALLRVYGDTHVVLRTDPLRTVLVRDPEARYAPPGQPEPAPAVLEESESDTDEAAPEGDVDVAAEALDAEPAERPLWGAAVIVPTKSPPFDAVIRDVIGQAPAPPPDDDAGSRMRCPFCGGILPPRMMINFCPHCGMGQDVGKCRTCGADMDLGWRFCVACGEEARGFAP
jgi:hypothetical protein